MPMTLGLPPPPPLSDSATHLHPQHLQTSTTIPPPPQTPCSKEMGLLIVDESQLVIPSSFLPLVSTPPVPPHSYLTSDLDNLIVLSFDIFYNPNLPGFSPLFPFVFYYVYKSCTVVDGTSVQNRRLDYPPEFAPSCSEVKDQTPKHHRTLLLGKGPGTLPSSRVLDTFDPNHSRAAGVTIIVVIEWT
ncbi:uncharacterized protein EI90DRAFT_3128263 [Cantharellus anzutake]|uniref:uncharacterized protein n=1 Tax=Cantharellus anzutake TaxID=1750568 RepID=UPI001906C8A5|nr:uncharacterized protein EI90DRAFT_3128263 [Cantharellus anzutake]KAF8326116.1 hypothetical protein EI90DRAFT_3128263 [Cantharellus anzutake]